MHMTGPVANGTPDGFTRPVWMALLATMIGTSGQLGYALGVMNAPSEHIKNLTKEISHRRYQTTISEYHQDVLYAIAVAVLALGGILGGCSATSLSDRLGRKATLLWSNIPAIGGSVLMTISGPMASFELFLIGRILVGYAVGTGTIVGPTYISEIVPITRRGSFAGSFQFIVAVALLLAQLLGLDFLLGQEDAWHFLFAVPIILSILQCALLMFSHESPLFLLRTQQRAAAERALQWFRCETKTEEIEAEIHIASTVIEKPHKRPVFRKCLLILAMTHAAQQLTGSAILLSFGNVILHRTHLRMSYTSYTMLACGLAYLSVAAAFIALIDRVGRRSLFLYGLIGMATTSCVIGITILKSRDIPLYHMIFLEIFAMMTHVGFYAMGPGAVPWMLATEMFLPTERTCASTIAIVVNWLAMFCMSVAFVPLFYAFGALVFLAYGAMCCVFWLLALLFVPETRGKTPEDVQILVAKGTVYKAKHHQWA